MWYFLIEYTYWKRYDDNIRHTTIIQGCKNDLVRYYIQEHHDFLWTFNVAFIMSSVCMPRARACPYLLTHTIIYTRTPYVCGCLAPHLSSDQYVWSTVFGAHTHTLKDAHVSNHMAMRIYTIKTPFFVHATPHLRTTYVVRRTSWLYVLHRTTFCRTTFLACISTLYVCNSNCTLYTII